MTVLVLSGEAIGRVCACGCGQSIDHLSQQARYATDGCRARAWKQRVGYVDQRSRKPSRNGTPRRRREGISVYLPDLHTAEIVRSTLRAHYATPSVKAAVDALDKAIERASKRAA